MFIGISAGQIAGAGSKIVRSDVVLIGDSYMDTASVGFYVWPDYSTAIAEAQINATSCQAGKRLIGGTLPVVDNIATILATHNNPTVCLAIGGNDNIATTTALNDLQRAMMTVITAIVADGRKLVIGGSAPILGYAGITATQNANNVAYHAWLQSICSEYGFEFVDYYDYLEGGTPDTYDSAKDNELIGPGGDLLHPNEASARYIASQWDAALARSESAPLVTSVPTYYQQYFTTAIDSRLQLSGTPTGQASTGQYTVSIWIKPTAVSTLQNLFHVYIPGFSSTAQTLTVNASATVKASTPFNGVAEFGTGTVTAGQKVHILLSADHASNKAYLYVNGAAAGSDTALTAYNATLYSSLWTFLNDNSGSDGLAGSFADIFYDDAYFDITDSAVRLKFRKADGTPADVYGATGTDGTIGYAPIAYYGSRSTLAQLNAGTNLGTGGTFTKTGTAFALTF